MVILEPDGTVAHDTRGVPHSGPLDIVAELLVPADAAERSVRYSFDVGGLGTVAVEVENALATVAASLPHRFVFRTGGLLA